VNRGPLAQRLPEYLIQRACRRLPDDTRDERQREWAAELPAILHDPGIAFAPRRWAGAVLYAAGAARAARVIGRPGRAAGRSRRPSRADRPARAGEPGALARRIVMGAGLYLGFVAVTIALLRLAGTHGGWPLIPVFAMAIGLAAFCLADLIRADQVRYLPKWAWALACLIQIPLGGIIYLCIGRARGPHRAAPGPSRPATPR